MSNNISGIILLTALTIVYNITSEEMNLLYPGFTIIWNIIMGFGIFIIIWSLIFVPDKLLKTNKKEKHHHKGGNIHEKSISESTKNKRKQKQL